MVATLTTSVATRQALAVQVAMFVQQRLSRYTWIMQDAKVTADDVFQMMKDGDDIAYSALKHLETSIERNTHTSRITLQCTYHEDLVQMQYVQNRLSSIVAPILRQYQTNHARVLQLHDWVVTNFRYDQTLTHYSAYAGLTGGRTVCNGYSMMFAYLCREAKIPCQIAAGDVLQRGPHAWNMVELDGAWYHLDTTWNSPKSDSPTSYIPYNYYMLTDGEMARTRKVGMQVRGKQTPTARTTYAEVLQHLCGKSHPHRNELERIRMHTGLIYTEPRYTITDKHALLRRVLTCIQDGLTQETVRYMVHPNRASIDMQWVQQHVYTAYPSYKRRVQATCQPYHRAGSNHSLVIMHFTERVQ